MSLCPFVSDRPITDVCVIYDREACPAGFEKLEFTVSGGSGNLNAGGNVFSPAVWLCVSRAPHPIGPITDLTILYLDRDDGGKLPPGYTLIDADLNKGSYGYAIGLCYTRARLTGSHTGPILDIGIVNIAAHDQIPPRYREIGGKRRNVNAGSFRDEMYIIVKHAIRDPLQVKYKPTIIDRYPRTEREGSLMPTSIALVSQERQRRKKSKGVSHAIDCISIFRLLIERFHSRAFFSCSCFSSVVPTVSS